MNGENMDENLKNAIEDYKKTNWNALLKGDVGKYNLKEIKPYLDFVKNFIDPLVENSHKLTVSQQSSLINLLNDFVNLREQIKNHTDISQNQNIINSSIHFKNSILDNFQNLSMALKIQKEYDPDKRLEKPEVEIKKYQSAVKEIEKILEQARRTQSQLSEKEMRKTREAEVSRYGDFFKTEAEKNRKWSLGFGIGFLVFSLVAGCFAYWFLKFDQNIIAQNLTELLIKGDVINKIFIFSIILFVISLIRREYLALRHQFVLNTHRHNALSSHKEILRSIEKTATGSDKEISNAVLLELTKSMFSPQDTGFVKNQTVASSENKIVEVSKSLFNNEK